jgi:hypothetical protein
MSRLDQLIWKGGTWGPLAPGGPGLARQLLSVVREL